jgi:hypothetical protein
VLPKSNDSPAPPTKLPKVAEVSLSIPFDLGSPERLEAPGPRRESISVPKVAVYEDCDFSTRENQVRTTRQVLEMLSEAKAATMEFRPDQSFQIGVLLSYLRHQCASLTLGESVFIAQNALPPRDVFVWNERSPSPISRVPHSPHGEKLAC